MFICHLTQLRILRLDLHGERIGGEVSLLIASFATKQVNVSHGVMKTIK
ncbi:MAG: hypothetical protein KAW52_05115 [candidate division Zixibacteria bacterium]|nr:hypothetical protein [candidate division Zixibacteria bacterium]